MVFRITTPILFLFVFIQACSEPGGLKKLSSVTPPVQIQPTYIQLAAGGRHTCGLKANSQVVCWGKNLFGQLGRGSVFFGDSNPQVVSGLDGVKDIVSGLDHSCALKNSGRVSCWGRNSDNELGNDVGDLSAVSVNVKHVQGAVQIAAGNHHTCALLQNGRVKCWGEGFGSEAVKIRISKVTKIFAGAQDACALLENGSASCWNVFDTTPQPPTQLTTYNGDPVSDIAKLAVGGGHICALTHAGKVICGGYNDFGQTGTGINNQPAEVTSLSRVVDIAAGTRNTCALQEDGKLFCWGRNHLGQLGVGDTNNRSFPSLVSIEGAQTFSLGLEHSCVQTAQMGVFCFGVDSFGQLGTGRTVRDLAVPQKLELENVEEIKSGFSHFCARLSDHSLRCWGNNQYNQLGVATTSDQLFSPEAVVSLPAITSVFLSQHGSCGLLSDSSAQCWGFGPVLGVGVGISSDTRLVPPTPLFGLSGVQEMYLGSGHGFARLNNGQVYGWGYNFNGEIGLGNTSGDIDNFHRRYPVILPALAGAIQLVAAYDFSCGIFAGGNVYCWGKAPLIGIGSTTSNQLTPLLVPNISNAVELDAKRDFVCARLSDNTAKCWGKNSYGQLGINNRIDQLSPRTVLGLSDVKQIEVGFGYACAVINDSSVKCWGNNEYGNLGLGNAENKRVATVVPGLTDVSQIALTSDVTCALKNDKTVSCWGFEEEGALGLGDLPRQVSPALVKSAP